MGTMAGMKPLHRLFQRASDMIQETSDSFEQHFLWLEEVVAEARQTFVTADLVMLPKTPSAPKRTRRVLKEDAENMPPPASARPSRQGRLCSKLASEKIQEQIRLDRVKKLRRPSSPIDQVLPSTAIKAKTHKNLHFDVSPSPSSPGDEPDKSPVSRCERATSSSPRSSRGNSKEAIKPKRFSTLQKDTNSPKKASISLQNDKNTSLRDGDSSSQNDLISSEKEVTLQQREGTTSPKDTLQNHSFPPSDSGSLHMETSSTISSNEVVSKSPDISLKCINVQENTENKKIQEEGAGDRSQNRNTATVEPEVHPQDEEEMHLQLDESFEECASAGESEEEQDIELVLDLPEGQKSESGTEKKKGDSPLPNNIPQASSVSAPVATCSKKDVEIQESLTSGSLLQSHCAPASRVTHTKQRAMAAQDASLDSCPQSPTVSVPRVTRTKQKIIKVQEIPTLSDSPPEPPAAPVTRVTRTKQRALEIQSTVPPPVNVPQPFAPAPRVTRTKQRAIDAQDGILPQENVLQHPTAPAPRVTRTKQRAIEKEHPPSSPDLPQPAPRVTRTKQKAREMEPPVSSQESTTMRPRTEDEDKVRSQITQDMTTHQHQPPESPGRGTRHTSAKDSGMFSLGTKRGGWSSVESLSSEESSARPARITRSKMSKLQQPHLSPGRFPASENFQRACHSPVGSVRSHSPSKGSPANRRLAGHSSKDGGKDPLAAEVLLSPLRVVRHSPDKTGKVLQARLPVVSGSSGRVTPNVIFRMQPFLSSSSSSSSSSEHRKIMKTVGTPSEGRRPANIVGGVTSFIKTQPARPTREDVERVRLQELQRKQKYEEETVRKKEQLLLAKAEEKKRCNEERMRRAKEARLKKEQMAAAAKEQQKLERQQREARQREEEDRIRQQQLAKKKAEEAKKAAKLKEEEERKKQEEEEKRKQKLEEEKRKQKLLEERRQKILEERRLKLEQEERKLDEERKNFLAKQRDALEEQRKLKEAKAQMLMKEKEEAERLKLKESLRILKERELQAKREQEAKTAMSNASTQKNTHITPLNTTITKESNSGPLNTTYTKPAASKQTNSYEITPLQPPRSSHSLNNYDINDMQSDESTDDEASPKKKIPQWAMKTQMQAAVLQQEHYPPKVDEIFPASALLIIPDLTQIFRQQKRRFKKRTSSAIWETPPSKYFRFRSPK
ncbi:inner centromere protein A-like isoform X2 [Portunus trituberculatus]|uniref:inner centromere protein A-like isoform X2 n=1 Tax=Portunus trituberculatus TaxID=210409 RepID=UPI001E1CF133|nr:inner centromere protein A-like isoform X2 [Portunus trituberculatus]